MRTPQPPHPSRRDAGSDLPETAGADGFSGRGLCCPDDPLELVLQLFPTDRAPSTLAALGIGGGEGEGEPPGPKREPAAQPLPLPLPGSACGGGDGGGWDSCVGLSSFLDGLLSDVDMFFADDEDALDGGRGGEAATEGNSLCDTTAAETKPPVHRPAAPAPAGCPVHVHVPDSLGGGAFAVVSNDATSPPGAFPLQAYDACPALDAAASNNALTTPVTVACGGAPPVVVTKPPLPALIMPAAPAPVFGTHNITPPLPPLMPPAAPAPPVFVTHNNNTPPLPALIMPAAPAPMPLPAFPARMPPAAGLHACGVLPGIVSNGAPTTPPSPRMVRMPARALLHPNAAALAGSVYSSGNAPAHARPSAAPSWTSPPSRASSGSGRSTSSSETSSEPEFLQHTRAWVIVPRKQRSPPAANRRKRPFVLDFPLRALPPAAPPPVNPGGDDDVNDDAKNWNAAAALPAALAPPPAGNTGADNDSAAAAGAGGIRRRRATPRQRNRQGGQRVCSHCHSPETPQWRAGPEGPGTLCNACGIRYAANRLLPEYRPSTAPSFRSGQHSNRHRKVMKLREQTMRTTKEETPSSSEQPMEDDGADEEDLIHGCI